jgi:hypothetical protein
MKLRIESPRRRTIGCWGFGSKQLIDFKVTDTKKAVSHCELGLQASYVCMLPRYRDIDAAMYDGSTMNGVMPNNQWFGETPRNRLGAFDSSFVLLPRKLTVEILFMNQRRR